MKTKKFLSTILAVVMTISSLPAFSLTVNADDNNEEKAISLGTSAIEVGDYVYYGNEGRNENLKWKILSQNGNATDGLDTTYFDSSTKYNLFGCEFMGNYQLTDFENSRYIAYDGWWYKETNMSPLFMECLTSYMMPYFNDTDPGLGGLEIYRYYISYIRQNINYNQYMNDCEYSNLLFTVKEGLYNDELVGDKIFIESRDEKITFCNNPDNPIFSIPDYFDPALVNDFELEWIRTLSTIYNPSVYIGADAVLDSVIGEWNTIKSANVRPACNLNSDNVLFTLPGSYSTGCVFRTLTVNEPMVVNNDAYKLTMKDNTRDFRITSDDDETIRCYIGDTDPISLNYYSSVTNKENNYISAMIVNDNTDEVLYYGQVKDLSNEVDNESAVQFTLPSDIEVGDYILHLFNEELHDETETNYASAFEEYDLSIVKRTPSASDFEFIPSVNGWTYNGNKQNVVVNSLRDGMGEFHIRYYTEDGNFLPGVPVNAGTYTFRIDTSESDLYKATDFGSITDPSWTFTIDKAYQNINTIYLPVAETLTYNGEEQDLVSYSHGMGIYASMMMYSLNNIDFSRSIPTAKDAGEYIVYYIIPGDSNHYDCTGEVVARINSIDSDTMIGSNADSVQYGKTLTIGTNVEKASKTYNDDTVRNIELMSVEDNYDKVNFFRYVSDDNFIYLGSADVEYDDDSQLAGSATFELNTIGRVGINSDRPLVIGENKIIATYDGNINLNGSNSNTITINMTPKCVNLYKDELALEYTGKPAEINVLLGDDSILSDDSVELVITPDEDINVGDHIATLELAGNDAKYYELPYEEVHYSIAYKSINSDNVIIGEFEEMIYNGEEQTPVAEVKTIDGLVVTGYWNEVTDINDTTEFRATGNFLGAIFEVDPGMKAATPIETSKTTARVKKNNVIMDATVTYGNIVGVDGMTLEGTYEWVLTDNENGLMDPSKVMISSNCTKQMKFTPTNTNYEPLTIDVEVTAYSTSGGGGGTAAKVSYTVDFVVTDDIHVETVVVSGNKVEIPVIDNSAEYEIIGWYIDESFENEFDFNTKIKSNLTLYAKLQYSKLDTADDTDEWVNPYIDVKEDDWFYENVKYVDQNGYMFGVDDALFGPNDNLFRGMLVTVLWRAENEPDAKTDIPFNDVDESMYYAEPIRWAVENNIVSGVSDDEFCPNIDITREQIATIIYRYLKYKGYDIKNMVIDIDRYIDSADISDWALESIMVMIEEGIMCGKSETILDPLGNATRAEFSAILERTNNLIVPGSASLTIDRCSI